MLSKYILALFRVLELSIRCRISASECRLNLPNLVAYGYPMSHQHRHHQKTYIRHLYTPPLQSPPLVVAAMIKTQATMSTHKGVNQCSKDVTQTQQQRPESPTVTLTWYGCKRNVHKLHQGCRVQPLLISIMASVDVKHHVYLLCKVSALGLRHVRDCDKLHRITTATVTIFQQQ